MGIGEVGGYGEIHRTATKIWGCATKGVTLRKGLETPWEGMDLDFYNGKYMILKHKFPQMCDNMLKANNCWLKCADLTCKLIGYRLGCPPPVAVRNEGL